MILAVIFLVGVSFSPSVGCAATASPLDCALLQDQASTPQQPASPAPAKAEPPAQVSPQAQGSSSSSTTAPSTTAKRKRHKKASSNCTSNSGQPANAVGNPSTQSASAAHPTPATNCPPSKTIVQQGGTSEPGIQLAGGPGGDPSAHQRDTVNRLLGPTEQNLKQIAGHQLTSDQQDMLNQIHQFMEQTKSAVADGDLERAGKLAGKAQELSEELAKPPQ